MSVQRTGLAALGADAQAAVGRAEKAESAREIGARIAAARSNAGLTGTQLGEAMGLGKDQVSKIESGKRRVDVAELAKAAARLGVSVRSLLGEPERSTLAVAARLAPGADQESMQPARRRARQLLELDDLLTRVADLAPARPSEAGQRVLAEARERFTQPPRGRPAARAQGRELAELTRRTLDLGSDSLGDFAGLIEQHFGVDVALSPSGTDGDGLCVHAAGTALILASTDFTDGHVRFTLAHELGHHLLGDPRDIIEEAEHEMFADEVLEWRVNAFAGHFLMPERGVRAVLEWLAPGQSRVEERALVALMEHFGVSRQALICQLNLLGLLSYEEGQQLQAASRARAVVARHRDVAPTGAATKIGRVRRPPQRLVRCALDAVATQRLGLSVVAALLERDDDQRLWSDIMGDQSPAAAVMADDDIDL